MDADDIAAQIARVTRDGWTVSFLYEDLHNGHQRGYRCVLINGPVVYVSPLAKRLGDAMQHVLEQTRV